MPLEQDPTRHRRPILGLCTLTLLIVLTGQAVSAQADRGRIVGRLVDPAGAVIPAAAVTATHEGTGVVSATSSDDRGVYVLLNLPVGVYRVEILKEGFRPHVVTPVRVGVQSMIALDAVLALGSVTETLTVSGDRDRLDSQGSALGTTLQRAAVAALPLTITSGRSIENFAYAVAPGVEGNNWTSNIVGAPPFSKEVLLDGTSATIQIQGHITESSPPMEAVEEYRVQTSGMAAEYGRTGGGVFTFSLRSGTNAMHGSLHGQFRHEALNANTPANEFLARLHPEQAGSYATPRDRQQVSGVSLGGPLAADRTFFFAAFEGYRQTRRQLGAYDRTVPTAAFLDGDFSALLDRTVQLGTDAAGNPIFRGAILDPHTGLVFPGNVLPASRLSPVSKQIADIYRRAYAPAIGGRLADNAAGPAYVDPSFTQQQASVKVDHNISGGSRVNGSLIWTHRPRTLADQGGIWDPTDRTGGPLSKARRHEVTTYQGRVGHSQVLSTSLLHEGTFTFSRFRNPNTTSSASGDWPSALGLDVAGAFGSFPQINFGDAVNGIDMTDVGLGTSNVSVADVYQVNESMTWAPASHVVKIGGEVRLIGLDSQGDDAYLTYNFSPTQTGIQSGPFANQVGFGFASFLLGEVASAALQVPTELEGRRNYMALYVQDDYRVGESLTLNLGLRWESTGGWTERYGRWSNFNTGRINPVTGVPGVLEYGDQVKGSFEGSRRYSQFGPRVGVAYARGLTVYRGAYGVFYAPVGTNFWAGVPYAFAPGFFGTNRVDPRGDGSPAFNWDVSGYPGVESAPTRDPALAQSGMVSINPDSLGAGRVQQWNAGFDRELGPGTTFSLNYVGNRGSGLPSGDLERNQPDPAAMKALLLAGQEWSWVADAESAAAAGVRYPYPGFAGPAWMAITPYPQAAAGWGPLFFVGSPLGQTSYHALQVAATTRNRYGVSGTASYVLSRQRGNVETVFQERWTPGAIQDVTRLDEEAAVIGASDRSHVVKGFVSWSLPFGAGRRFLSNATGISRALVSGWTVSALLRYESGLPLAIRSSNAYGGWQYPIYVNRDPGIPLREPFDGSDFDLGEPAAAANRYFNPAAFSNPAYGDLGRGPGRFAELRGFGAAYEDVGILKDFRVARYRVQLRVEIFNVFDRRYFADPDTNIASASFGHVTSFGWQTPRQGQIGLRLDW